MHQHGIGRLSRRNEEIAERDSCEAGTGAEKKMGGEAGYGRRYGAGG